MRLPAPQPDWPEAWRETAIYDRIELVGERARLGSYYAYQARMARVLEAVKRLARPGARILDVAAAQGNYTLALAEAGYAVTWNDLRPETIGYVELKRQGGAVEYRPGDIFETDFGAPFDLIIALEVIEHVAHPDRLLARLRQLVKPDGHIVLTTPNGENLRNDLPKFSDHPDPSMFESQQFKPDADGHIFLLHADEFAPLGARSGLELRELRWGTSFLTTGWLKSAWLLRLMPRGLVMGLERLACAAPLWLRRRITTSILAVYSPRQDKA